MISKYKAYKDMGKKTWNSTVSKLVVVKKKTQKQPFYGHYTG